MKRRLVSILVLVGFLAVPTALSAKLGDTEARARANSAKWKKKYGAVDPIIQVNKNGKVIFECWAGPPEMWSLDTAMAFAKELLPAKLKKKSPKKGMVDGSYHPYIYPDGTKIVIGPGLGGKFANVEVRAPEYKGPGC